MQGLVMLVGRILLATMFVSAGWSKIGGFEGTQGYMESMGVPGALLPLVILLEFGGGLAIIVGLGTRTISTFLALFCVASAVLFHSDFSQPMQSVMFMKNLAIAGGFLVLAAHGPGAISIDGRIGRRW
ncbi:MAG: DoxX family protein [Oceanospirillaceae bacterium]|nr:DoxX family protein [Oceanospirillaceae bacterium]